MLHYDAKQQSHEWGQMHVRRELQPLRWKLVQLKKKRKKKGSLHSETVHVGHH